MALKDRIGRSRSPTRVHQGPQGLELVSQIRRGLNPELFPTSGRAKAMQPTYLIRAWHVPIGHCHRHRHRLSCPDSHLPKREHALRRTQPRNPPEPRGGPIDAARRHFPGLDLSCDAFWISSDPPRTESEEVVDLVLVVAGWQTPISDQYGCDWTGLPWSRLRWSTRGSWLRTFALDSRTETLRSRRIGDLDQDMSCTEAGGDHIDPPPWCKCGSQSGQKQANWFSFPCWCRWCLPCPS